jgi:hypothetical protein
MSAWLGALCACRLGGHFFSILNEKIRPNLSFMISLQKLCFGSNYKLSQNAFYDFSKTLAQLLVWRIFNLKSFPSVKEKILLVRV